MFAVSPAPSPAGAAVGVIFLFLFGSLGLIAYCVPLIVAAARHSPNTSQVAVIDLLLGWTVIGWVIALAMALKPLPPRLPGWQNSPGR